MATDIFSPAEPAHRRRAQIVSLVGQRGFARVAELAEHLGVSQVTIRTDLDLLERRGELRRVRGGAVRRAVTAPELPFEQVLGAHAVEKRAIGHAAAQSVNSGDTLLLDVGTTTYAVATALAERTDLSDVTAVTNGLTIALALERAHPRIQVIVTGGTLRPLQHSLVDPMGGVLLEHLNVGTAFIGCNGVDAEAGVTNINLPEAEMKRRMVAAARTRVVVADGSKIGAVALARLCDLSEVDLLLTGSSADPAALAGLRDTGIEVLMADSPEPTAGSSGNSRAVFASRSNGTEVSTMKEPR